MEPYWKTKSSTAFRLTPSTLLDSDRTAQLPTLKVHRNLLTKAMPSYAITGASKGIGREFVTQLAADVSNTVFAIVRDPDAAADKNLFPKKANVHIVKGNVTEPTSILAAAKAIGTINNGSLDVLIHNANAMDMDGRALKPSQFSLDFEATEKAFHLTLLTGVYGSLWATNAFLPLIENGNEKKIIHISSLMAATDVILQSGIDYGLPYSVAKAGMNVQVAKYAVEFAPKGIKFLAMSPGWVDTWEGPGR